MKRNVFKLLCLLITMLILIGCNVDEKIIVTYYFNNEANTVEVDKGIVLSNDSFVNVESDSNEGLYLDENYITKYNNEEIKEDITLYIKIKEVTVTIKLEDQEQLININYGSTINVSMISLIEQEKIEGLYLDENYITKYNNEEIKEDITLYIKVKKITITIKYKDQEESININIGSIIKESMINLLDEAQIEGLYYDSELLNKYNKESLDENTTLYLKIKEIIVTYEFKNKTKEIK